MIITLNEGVVEVTAPEIADYLNNIDIYTGVRLTVTETCATPYTQELDNNAVTDGSGDFWIDTGSDTLLILPEFIGLTDFRDSILKIDVRFQKVDGFVLISNCAFIDTSYSCKVAASMQNIAKENGTPKSQEPVASMVHLLHYSLVNGSNCGCNCPEMCQVFIELTKLLTGIDQTILNDCNC